MPFEIPGANQSLADYRSRTDDETMDDFDYTLGEEIRGPLPRACLEMIDAKSLAAGTSRIAVLRDILLKETIRFRHECTFMHRVTRRNGKLAEGGE